MTQPPRLIDARPAASPPLLRVTLPPDYLGRRMQHEINASALILLLANHYLVRGGAPASALWHSQRPLREDRSTSQERKPRP